jgi:hypothetical protein
LPPKLRRVWRHRTKVYKNYDAVGWRWDCCLCTWVKNPLIYATQFDAFQAASNHAYLGGYRLDYGIEPA